jgi:hypothetical protein
VSFPSPYVVSRKILSRSALYLAELVKSSDAIRRAMLYPRMVPGSISPRNKERAECKEHAIGLIRVYFPFSFTNREYVLVFIINRIIIK